MKFCDWFMLLVGCALIAGAIAWACKMPCWIQVMLGLGLFLASRAAIEAICK